MSETPSFEPHDEADLLAAEYALGVLDADARHDAEARIAREPAFADAIAHWQDLLTPMAEPVGVVPPPAHVWHQIAEAVAAARRLTAGRAETPPSLWDRAGFWRWLTLATGAIAAAAVAVLVYVVQVPPALPGMMARLDPPAGAPTPATFYATVDASGRSLTIVPVTATSLNGRVPELWLIPPGSAPRSLGVVDPARPQRVAIPEGWLGAGVSVTDVALAITPEPPGGAPDGIPSGPVIAVGKVQRL